LADKSNKFKDNVAGKFYVDEECIACDACVMTADEMFGMDEDDGHAFVKKQPVTDEEMELAKEAMEGCPVEAIGDDGNEEGSDD
jgi:ferredoxin